MSTVMVSRGLSLKGLIGLYLLCGFGFGAFIVLFLRGIGITNPNPIWGGVLYLVVVTVCFLGFAVDWDYVFRNTEESGAEKKEVG